MKIVSLEPYITELLCTLEVQEQVVGVSFGCQPKKLNELIATGACQVVTEPSRRGCEYCHDLLHIDKLEELDFDLILTSAPHEEERLDEIDNRNLERSLSEKLSNKLGREVTLKNYSPTTLGEAFQCIEDITKEVGAKKLDTVNLIRAHYQNLTSNFYERMRNKRVTFISSLNPLSLAGKWIPDMINLCAARSQNTNFSDAKVEWNEIVAFRPDVMVIAPKGAPLSIVLRTLKTFESYPGWDDLPAVKRGEVYFCGGDELFYRPNYALVDSMSVLVSALAGFESGYITERDLFYKLRYLELHRNQI